ncbi:MAG: hypothetical protein ACK5M3_18550 [Dysgonomonas sp.]
MPYHLKNELDQSVDLTTLPNIEELIVNKYNKIRDAVVRKDQRDFNYLEYHNSLTFYNTIYYIEKKTLKKVRLHDLYLCQIVYRVEKFYLLKIMK